MVEKLKRLKKLRELERLLELEKLEALKKSYRNLENERKKLQKLADEKLKNFSGRETLYELAAIGGRLVELEREKEKQKRQLLKQEEVVKELNVEIKAIETYVEKKERDLQKEEERKENLKRTNEYLLKRSYGKFLTLLLILLPLVVKAETVTNPPPYADKLLKPYLKMQNDEFEKLAQKLLNSFHKLEEKEKELEEKKRFLLQKEQELKELLKEAKNLEQKHREELSQKVNKLLKIISKSDPDSAGEILSKTDPKVAAEVLINLPKVRKAGEILSAMEPESAAKVIDILLKKKEQTKLSVIRNKIEELLKYVEGNSF